MPPFGKLAAVIVSGPNPGDTERAAQWLGQAAFNDADITTLGPAPAPIFMLRNKYRYRLLLKTARNIPIQTVLRQWLAKVKVPSSVRVEVDVDPYSFY